MAISQTQKACNAMRNRAPISKAARKHAVPERVRKARSNGRTKTYSAKQVAALNASAAALEAALPVALSIGFAMHAAHLATERMRNTDTQAEVRAIIRECAKNAEHYVMQGVEVEDALRTSLEYMDASAKARAWFKQQSIL